MTTPGARAGGDLIERLRSAGRADPARMPALAAILQDSAARLSAAMGEIVGGATPLTLASSLPVATDSGAWRGGPHVRATFEAPDWPTLTIGMDRASLAAMVDAMFGGDGSEAADAAGRPISTLERRAGARACAALAQALSDAFADTVDCGFSLRSVEVVEGPPKPTALAALHLCYAAGPPERRVRIFALLPQAPLTAARGRLSTAETAVPQTSSGDPAWSGALRFALARTDLLVQAAIHEPGLTLADLASLEIGRVLPLRAAPDAPVDLLCEGHALAQGRLGQSRGAYTVMVGDEEIGSDEP